MAPIDGAAQESARRFRFAAEGAVVVIGGPPTPGDPTLAVSIRYRADAPIQVAIGPGVVALPVAPDWITTAVPLRCFESTQPARLARFQITAPAGSEVSIEDLRIVTPATGACPLRRQDVRIYSFFVLPGSPGRPICAPGL